MDYLEEKDNKKQILIFGGVIFLIVIIILVVVFTSKASKQKKIEEEKRKRAESLKVEDLLNEISKENWQETVNKECKVSQKSPSFNGFSWLEGKRKKQEESAIMYIEAKKLNIFFKDGNGKCCGNLESFWKKLEPHFKNHEFTQNNNNSSPQNYTFAFENDGLKCVYGYKDIIDGKYFCEFGIICGRENEFITQNSDLGGMLEVLRPSPPGFITIDKIAETIYGKFVKGKMGFIFFDNVGEKFLLRKKVNENWENITNIINRDPIPCTFLLDEKIPPEIVNKCFDYNTNKEVSYEKLYKEKYK